MSTSKPSDTPSQAPYRAMPRRAAEVDRFVDTFLSTVCDTSRRYILELLTIADDGALNTLPERRSGDIARMIGLSAATTSEHLRQLTQTGLVTSRREGNTVYYRLRNHHLVYAFRELLNALDKDYLARLEKPQHD